MNDPISSQTLWAAGVSGTFGIVATWLASRFKNRSDREAMASKTLDAQFQAVFRGTEVAMTGWEKMATELQEQAYKLRARVEWLETQDEKRMIRIRELTDAEEKCAVRLAAVEADIAQVIREKSELAYELSRFRMGLGAPPEGKDG